MFEADVINVKSLGRFANEWFIHKSIRSYLTRGNTNQKNKRIECSAEMGWSYIRFIHFTDRV